MERDGRCISEMVLPKSSPLHDEPDLTITTKSNVWKEVVAKLRNPLVAITTGALKIEGGSKQFKEFMGMFSDEDAS